jgi:cytoskeletal protein RodZ
MTNLTPGSILRQTREEKKLSLDQVFNAIKIRVNYLQALENDQLDLLPSRAQARGFIRLYASYLGLDPYSLLEPPAPEVPIVEESVETIEIEHEAAEEEAGVETTPATIKDRVDGLVKRSADKIKARTHSGAEHVKGKVQSLVDKIPFTIVRKGQEAPAVEVQKGETPEPPTAAKPHKKKTSQVMSNAIGEDLRKAREALGLSLADVERQIRIREIYLGAIEEGNLDQLPSTVQGRGMLSNYASFLNLDAENYLSRFAEVLQQKRLETLSEAEAGVPIPADTTKQAISGVKKLFSPDLIFTGGIFLVFFVFIVWGAFQLMGIGGSKPGSTPIPISDVLLASGTPTSREMITVETSLPTMTDGMQVFTAETTQESTQVFSSTDPIQLTIAANKRTFMQVIVDGKTAFLGRTTPGNVYTYSGKTRINLLSGDASALQVYYNSTNLGIMGVIGQVINMDFTTSGTTDNTANYTPTPTVTTIASLTPEPSATPTVTPIAPTEIIPAGTVIP